MRSISLGFWFCFLLIFGLSIPAYGQTSSCKHHYKFGKPSLADYHLCRLGYYLKVIYDGKKKEAIAFILPHEKNPSSKLPEFIRSVDEVEEKTAYNFLRKLSNTLEKKVEKDRQEGLW